MKKIAYLCISDVKMMQTIRKIVSIVLVSLLLATTGGFSIYRHVCYYLGNSSSSIFFKATCEHENSGKKSSCCSVDKTPSCCSEKPVPVSKTTYHKDRCCHNSGSFLKISDWFQPGAENVTLKPFTVTSALFFFDYAIDESINPSLNLYNADLPPPDTGRQILVAHHQLKLAPALV